MHDNYDVCLVARMNPRDLIPPPSDLVEEGKDHWGQHCYRSFCCVCKGDVRKGESSWASIHVLCMHSGPCAKQLVMGTARRSVQSPTSGTLTWLGWTRHYKDWMWWCHKGSTGWVPQKCRGWRTLTLWGTQGQHCQEAGLHQRLGGWGGSRPMCAIDSEITDSWVKARGGPGCLDHCLCYKG